MTADAPLLIPLAGLLAEVPGSSRRIVVDEPTLPLAVELALAEPVRGEVEIARTNRGVYLRGHLRTALAEACSRCLRDAVAPIAVDLAEEVLPSVELTTGAPLDTSAEPEVARLDGHHRLDLGALVAEAVSLAEPIAPLCEPACPGLCGTCGDRLGTAHVAHAVEDVDPRLEALRGFRVDADDETG